MKKIRKILGIVLALLLIVSLFAGCGQKEETYPSRNINCIVYSSAGSSPDNLARGITPLMQEQLGGSISVTNMESANGVAGSQYVLDQDADGYTILFGSEMFSCFQVLGLSDISVEDFETIKLCALGVPALAVGPDSEFATAEELIAYAKDNPGAVRLGTAGAGTTGHIVGLMLEEALGVEFTYVPFSSGSESVSAVMGGHIECCIELAHIMIENHKGGNLTILTTMTNEPLEGTDIPAMGELIPEMQSYLPFGPYFGVWVKKDTPQEIVDALTAAMDTAMASQTWQDYTDSLYIQRIDYKGEAALEYINNWTSQVSWMLYDVGATEYSPEEFGIPRLEK